MISRNEIADMSIEELTDLLSNVLMVTLVKGGEADRIIPDGFEVDCETENLKIRFDIDIDIKSKKSGVKAFKDFIDNCSCHIYKPGELDE